VKTVLRFAGGWEYEMEAKDRRERAKMVLMMEGEIMKGSSGRFTKRNEKSSPFGSRLRLLRLSPHLYGDPRLFFHLYALDHPLAVIAILFDGYY